MPDQTILQALEVQEFHLDLYCPKGKEWSNDVRDAIIKATNIAGLVLDKPMPVYLVSGIVPTSHEIKDEIFKWKLASYTHEVSKEDFECAFGSVPPRRNHYPDQFLCGEELIADAIGRDYYGHYYMKQVDNETKFFTKPALIEQYDRQFNKAKE